MTLFGRLALHAAERPQACALEWPGGRMDYAELRGVLADLRRQLNELDVRVLALDADNGPAWVLIDIAAMQLGLCLVPLPPFFSTRQKRHVLERAGVELVLSDRSDDLQQVLPGPAKVANAGLTVAGSEITLLWTGVSTSPAAAQRRLRGSQKITFTSGTTGEPKGVMLTREQVWPVVASLVDAAGMTATDKHLALMPLAVLLENIAGVYAPLWAGACVSLAPLREVGMAGSSGIDGQRMARILTAVHASTAIFTPQTLHAVTEHLEAHHKDSRPALRFAAVGGAAVAPRLLQRATDAGIPVYEGYGLSECASVVCLNTAAQHRPGSVGRPLPHVRLRVDASGEVQIKSAGFVGYLGESPNAEDEWESGDLGRLDDDGFLYLTGRRRNVFITAFGRNVAPEWVERELTLEPEILQAAVFGEARSFNVAVIVPAAQAAACDVDLALARANRNLPDYARVSAWVPAEAPFSPANDLLTGTGRIRRDAMAAAYCNAIESLYRESQTS